MISRILKENGKVPATEPTVSVRLDMNGPNPFEQLRAANVAFEWGGRPAQPHRVVEMANGEIWFQQWAVPYAFDGNVFTPAALSAKVAVLPTRRPPPVSAAAPKKKPKPQYITPSPERNAEIYRLRMAGLTLQSIGEKFGIGRERVRTICWKVGRQEIKKAEKELRRRRRARRTAPPAMIESDWVTWTPEMQFREIEAAYGRQFD